MTPPTHSSTGIVQEETHSVTSVSQIVTFGETSYFETLKAKALRRKARATAADAYDVQNGPKAEDIQGQSMHLSHIYRCQTGILTPFDLFEHGLYLILHLSNQSTTDVMKACGNLTPLKESISESHPGCRLEVTLGLGYSTTREWLARANLPFPKSFIEFQAKEGPTGKTMPSTGGDVLLHIRSNRKDLCFELGRRFCHSIPNVCIAQLDDTFGYAYMSSKSNGLSQDFTGFEDGNENPKTDELRAKAALIGKDDDDAVHVGGSFALTQKWKHDLIKWNGMSPQEQADVIGRTKGEDSQKIRPKHPTSHVARTDLKENGVDIKVIRQSLPYGDMKEHGLFFISYASQLRKHERQLDSMVGIGDGIYDRIMDFSTPLTGNYWFIPSIHVLNKICPL